MCFCSNGVVRMHGSVIQRHKSQIYFECAVLVVLYHLCVLFWRKCSPTVQSFLDKFIWKCVKWVENVISSLIRSSFFGKKLCKDFYNVTDSTKIWSSTAVFSIDNNQTCFLSSKSVYYYDFWRSCDTEDWTLNSAAHHRNKLYITLENKIKL